MMTTHREYRPQRFEQRTIPTADLAIGHHINFPGAGAVLPIAGIQRRGDEVGLIGVYESWGRLRRTFVWRKVAGRSKIHVPLADGEAPA